MKHKKLFISLTAVCTALLALGIFLIVWFAGDGYKDFTGGDFDKEFEIPGLGDGAVPQGIGSCYANYQTEVNGETKTVNQPYFFISAYMNDGSASRIYVVGKKTGYTGYVTLKDEDGNDFKGHCGGVAINNSVSSSLTENTCKGYTLWVTGENNVYVAKPSAEYAKAKKTIAQEIVEKAAGIRLNDETEPDNSVKFTKSFKANCKASFCFYFDDPRYSQASFDKLYVGEFYRDGNYPTDDTHKFMTPAGYKNTAFMYEYTVDTSSESYDFGLEKLGGTSSSSSSVKDQFIGENNVPRIQRIFSLPEKIQGVAFSGRAGSGTNDGYMVLSESYGLSNSNIMLFDYKKVISSGKKYNTVSKDKLSFEYEGVKQTVGGYERNYTDSSLSVYFVDKADNEMFVKNYSVPSMSEGMCIVTPPTSNSGSKIDKVYVLFESASKKYGTFVREKLKNVYSLIPH